MNDMDNVDVDDLIDVETDGAATVMDEESKSGELVTIDNQRGVREREARGRQRAEVEEMADAGLVLQANR